MSLWHRIEHFFGWNVGNVVSWWGDDNCAYIGFQCAKCGRVTGERMRGKLMRTTPQEKP